MATFENGIFTISLDFELHWGVAPRCSISEYKQNLDGTREAIEGMLKIFESNNIHVTWAIVGFLFAEDKKEIKRLNPLNLPHYNNSKYDNYRIIEEVGNNEIEDPYHFASSIIAKILKCPNQEIASHTYSHLFHLEDNINFKDIENDIVSFKAITESLNVPINTIIFPRNQYSHESLDLYYENGFQFFRGNNDNFINRPRKRSEEHPIIRSLRFLDSFFPIFNNLIKPPQKTSNILINIKASRFLRPYSTKYKMLERLKMRRIKNEMSKAAKTKKLYHLWWHPHNFGLNTLENLCMLQEIVNHFNSLKKEYGMISASCNEFDNL
ncbi:MAG: polysaccharide deacetylase family protein [Saprospiraceae bacterium]|nr:polysaccharide deacetylase family protein [Saprospiraceae bacterium]